MNGNPLGKYTEAVTAGISVFVIVSAVILHIIEGYAGIDFDTSFVDNVALIAVGVLFGGRAVANGAKEAMKEPMHDMESKVEAAHRRLDAIDAPHIESQSESATHE